MKTRTKILVLVAAAGIVGGGVLVYTLAGVGTRSAPVAATAAQALVTRGNIVVTVPASGQFEPTATTTVRPDPNLPQRRITEVLVAVGDKVVAGQIVARVDTTGLEIDLASAKSNFDAQTAKLNILRATPTPNDLVQAHSAVTQSDFTLKSAQSAYDSTRKLAEEGLASAQQLLDAQKTLDSAKAGVEAANFNFDTVKTGPTDDLMQAQISAVSQALSAYRKAQIIWDATSIRTPVAGTVAQVGVNPGDLVSATSIVQVSDNGTNQVNSNNAVCVVIQNDPAVLQALVDETDVSRIRLGQTAIVTPIAFPEQRLTGTVSSIAQQATTTQNVTSLTVSIDIPNANGKLLWGMNADALINVLERRAVLLVPSTAVQRNGNSSIVSVLNGTDFNPTEVKLGATDGIHTEVLAGLNEGDTILAGRSGAARGAVTGRQNPQNFIFRAMH